MENISMPQNILGASSGLADLFLNLQATVQPFAIIDILIVSTLFYLAYQLIRQTRAVGIIYGIGMLAIVWLLGQVLDLTLLNTILKWIVTSILVAIPVVFQPELRNALEKIGRTPHYVTDYRRLSAVQMDAILQEVFKAVKVLVHNHYGALIVFTKKTGLKEYIENGENLDAKLSAKLIVNIFTPKAPLHDGAIIIKGNFITAAAVTLPLNEDVTDLTLGTRHKAGLSLALLSDAAILIISEETGSISLAKDGYLEKNINYDSAFQSLKQYLIRK